MLFDAKTQVNKQRGSYMMTDKVLGNNQVNVYGEVISDFTFSHEVYGEGFYTLQLSVRRLSNVFDTIPLMVSERLIDVKQVPAAELHALAVVGRDMALLAVLRVYEARARAFEQLAVKEGFVELGAGNGIAGGVGKVCHGVDVLSFLSFVLRFSGKNNAA